MERSENWKNTTCIIFDWPICILMVYGYIFFIIYEPSTHWRHIYLNRACDSLTVIREVTLRKMDKPWGSLVSKVESLHCMSVSEFLCWYISNMWCYSIKSFKFNYKRYLLILSLLFSFKWAWSGFWSIFSRFQCLQCYSKVFVMVNQNLSVSRLVITRCRANKSV